jgi:hypothetical protein
VAPGRLVYLIPAPPSRFQSYSLSSSLYLRISLARSLIPSRGLILRIRFVCAPIGLHLDGSVEERGGGGKAS